MGIMDSLSNFLGQRDGDFVKLDSMSNAFGPGPLLCCYGIPAGIDDEEIQDMIADGAPSAASKAKVVRVSDTDDNVMDLSLQEALESMVDGSLATTTTASLETSAAALDVPVLFFSGFGNAEMMAVYNILGREIYEETGGRSKSACAKAVPNAMEKPLRQVLTEIASDHTDAIASSQA